MSTPLPDNAPRRAKRIAPVILTAATVFIWPVLSPDVQGQRGQTPLPDGPGRDLVATTCNQCHSLNLIAGSWGYTQEGWQQLFSSMVAMPGIQASVVADYLATNFPEKPDTPQAVIISGPVDVTIREWLLPTLGQRPHDPLAARDGSIWWTGQYASRLGRLDPRTSVATEYRLQTPNSGPHGLVEDEDGNIWYTGINVRQIGKLDSRTGTVTEFELPDPARGPHTPILDGSGMLFFTLQSGHVGRLNTTTGEMRVAKTPTNNTYPYGIQLNSKGIPWYVDFNGSRIGSVDPATMEIREYALPDPAARPRRLAITPDDAVWYTDYARGYRGRFDPITGRVREWPSPGGRPSRPYAIASVGDVLWYSESGVKPNTLVRFDSASQEFQTWAIPSGGGVVRNMMATPDGSLVLACSGVNRVALVEVRNPADAR
jgi:virginiamycin B lyase